MGDAIALNKGRLPDYKLLLYSAKTDTPVYVPVPPAVMAVLVDAETPEKGRFFSTGFRVACEQSRARRPPVGAGRILHAAVPAAVAPEAWRAVVVLTVLNAPMMEAGWTLAGIFVRL